MMTRASRWLKWVGAGALLLAAAPIAYADGARHTGTSVPASGAFAPHTGPGEAGRSAGCGRDAADFVGAYLVPGPAGETLDFRADGSVTVSFPGRAATTGTWHASGGAITWTAGTATFASVPGEVACADPSHAGRVGSFTAVSTDGATDSLTPQRF